MYLHRARLACWRSASRSCVMPKRIECAGLQIDEALHSLLVQEIAPGTGIEPDHFWQGLANIWAALGPENKRLLAERDSLQAQIDQWHRDHREESFNAEAYEAFLREIGYLHPEPTPFTITTDNVDPEIATIAGPQLVVPVMNARYALNAANARWGSLYDALYGTDAIPEDGGAERGGAYNPVRGERVIVWARDFLDTHCTLTGGTHADATAYVITAGALRRAIGLADAPPIHADITGGTLAAAPTAAITTTLLAITSGHAHIKAEPLGAAALPFRARTTLATAAIRAAVLALTGRDAGPCDALTGLADQADVAPPTAPAAAVISALLTLTLGGAGPRALEGEGAARVFAALTAKVAVLWVPATGVLTGLDEGLSVLTPVEEEAVTAAFVGQLTAGARGRDALACFTGLISAAASTAPTAAVGATAQAITGGCA